METTLDGKMCIAQLKILYVVFAYEMCVKIGLIIL